MKKTILVAVLACACIVGRAWAQPPADCTPNALNIPNAPYPCVLPDNRVMFRVLAPDAQKLTVRLGKGFDMTKGADGLWSVTTTPMVVGFHYYTLSIDGAVVADPATRTFFGSGWDNSGIEIPEPDGGSYTLKNVAHGQVSQVLYQSKVNGTTRRCFVYTPPGYDKDTKSRYPVLYLQHGWGENEQGWHVQGHVDVIMDNLIAEKKAVPFIIVMDNGTWTPAPGQERPRPAAPPAGGAAGAPGAAPQGRPANWPPPGWADKFKKTLLEDIIPMVDATFRTRADQPHRAMAGLSMGGMQTNAIAMENLDVFSHVGLFSGGTVGDPATAHNGVMANAKAFNKKMKLIFQSCGSRERPENVKASYEQLKAAGINTVMYVSLETAHEWQTWRRSLHESAPLLFRK